MISYSLNSEYIRAAVKIVLTAALMYSVDGWVDFGEQPQLEYTHLQSHYSSSTQTHAGSSTTAAKGLAFLESEFIKTGTI